MRPLHNLAVYCGSNYGETPDYCQHAKQLGAVLAQQHIHLVYGGGIRGLMGVIANSVLENGGTATGVITHFLINKEHAHPHLNRLITTDTMPERKSKMIELADGFIAMAGGIGTYEELFEVISLLQLRQSRKPIGLLNVNGFFDPFIAMLRHTAEQGFMPMADLELLCVSDNAADLVAQMRTIQFVEAPKWVVPQWAKEMGYGAPQ